MCECACACECVCECGASILECKRVRVCVDENELQRERERASKNLIEQTEIKFYWVSKTPATVLCQPQPIKLIPN